MTIRASGSDPELDALGRPLDSMSDSAACLYHDGRRVHCEGNVCGRAVFGSLSTFLLARGFDCEDVRDMAAAVTGGRTLMLQRSDAGGGERGGWQSRGSAA